MLKKKNNNKGFTLVELLVVIAIIGILAVVAVPALFKNIEKGKVADLEADISAIRSAALSVYADSSMLPVETIDGSGVGTGNLIYSELEGLSKPFGGTYATKLVGTNSEKLLLEIAVTNGISADGAKKLANDLGDKYVDESGAQISSANAQAIGASGSI
ncbi:MAG: type II secretion system protein, partial [Clostridium sp.]